MALKQFNFNLTPEEEIALADPYAPDPADVLNEEIKHATPQEAAARLREDVAMLALRERQVLDLLYGPIALSYGEAAHVLGIRVRDVRQLESNGLTHLREDKFLRTLYRDAYSGAA